VCQKRTAAGFVKQLEPFVEWLQKAEVESGGEE